jgi:hypothetical protein
MRLSVAKLDSPVNRVAVADGYLDYPLPAKESAENSTTNAIDWAKPPMIFSIGAGLYL